jgi:hypothetical protein
MEDNQAREHYASFPAGAVNQKCSKLEKSGAAFPPVLAGIRAPKSNRIAFPCCVHSGVPCGRQKLFCACLPLRGQHTPVRDERVFPV